MNWLDLLGTATEQRQQSVLIVVAAVRGSAPRAPGAAMLVTQSGIEGTIGGGQLEFVAIETARTMLSDDAGASRLLRYDLVPSSSQPHVIGKVGETAGVVSDDATRTKLGQCCGGVVLIHYQRVAAQRPDWLQKLMASRDASTTTLLVSTHDGASAATAQILQQRDLCDGMALDPRLRDARPRLLRLFDADAGDSDLVFDLNGSDIKSTDHPAYVLALRVDAEDFVPVVFGAGHVGRALVPILATVCRRLVWHDERDGAFPSVVPRNVSCTSGDSAALIAEASPAAYFVVMTHSHPLDLALCESILHAGRFNYLGLIGSRSKKLQFEKSLRRRGIDQALLSRLTCPIGIDGIHDKDPAAIAIAVAAQMLQVREQRALANHPQSSDCGSMMLTRD